MNSEKYYCKKCSFKCKYESIWKQHIDTLKHKNNGKIIRKTLINYNKICDKCNFIAKHNEGFKNHILTKHCSREDREKEFTNYCAQCDFGTFSNKLFILHNSTKKHKNNLL